MDMKKIIILMIVMALSTYAVRAIPFTLMRKKVKNRFLKSMLAYMPYAILSAMTLPAIFYATEDPVLSAAGFAAGLIAALLGRSLVEVSLATCIVAIVLWLIL